MFLLWKLVFLQNTDKSRFFFYFLFFYFRSSYIHLHSNQITLSCAGALHVNVYYTFLII